MSRVCRDFVVCTLHLGLTFSLGDWLTSPHECSLGMVDENDDSASVEYISMSLGSERLGLTSNTGLQQAAYAEKL